MIKFLTVVFALFVASVGVGHTVFDLEIDRAGSKTRARPELAA